ncbi:MAG TPA: hypothetical protein PLW27_04160 [Kiritimatiellia bacterium]|nr:hypothetical protein [Kiritimatiellia bacterium]HQL49941.1 hypothetical protein [Kiritimatiellia bacterium]
MRVMSLGFGAVLVGCRVLAGNGNLLVNGGFEAELAPAWERRTPEDASRKIYRASGEGRTGAAVIGCGA